MYASRLRIMPARSRFNGERLGFWLGRDDPVLIDQQWDSGASCDEQDVSVSLSGEFKGKFMILHLEVRFSQDEGVPWDAGDIQ